MNLDDLRRIENAAKESAFRLETLPQYLVPGEAERFAMWSSEEPMPSRTPENNEWLARIQRDTDRRFRWYRVHILDQPLTAYLRFELYSYLEGVAVGNEIYVADRDAHSNLADLHEDFWIFDDEIGVRMFYDDEGHFLYPELIDDLEPYRKVRDDALRHAEPLSGYLARKGLTPDPQDDLLTELSRACNYSNGVDHGPTTAVCQLQGRRLDLSQHLGRRRDTRGRHCGRQAA